VSWVAQVPNVAGAVGTFLTHVASTWGPGPLRGLAVVSRPNLLTNDARSLGQGPLAALRSLGQGPLAALRSLGQGPLAALRSLGQGPLAALRSLGLGPLAALALNVNSTTQPAAKQAGFAPHDLVS